MIFKIYNHIMFKILFKMIRILLILFIQRIFNHQLIYYFQQYLYNKDMNNYHH